MQCADGNRFCSRLQCYMNLWFMSTLLNNSSDILVTAISKYNEYNNTYLFFSSKSLFALCRCAGISSASKSFIWLRSFSWLSLPFGLAKWKLYEVSLCKTIWSWTFELVSGLIRWTKNNFDCYLNHRDLVRKCFEKAILFTSTEDQSDQGKYFNSNIYPRFLGNFLKYLIPIHKHTYIVKVQH